MQQNYIISLTSTPARFEFIEPALKSLLAQTIKPERVILYINRHYARYPDWDGTLPDVPEGVEVKIVDEDYGPATKLLPALKEYWGQDKEILFLDDDQVYKPFLAERFFRAREKHPDACISTSGMDDYDTPDNAPRAFYPRPRSLRNWRITDVGFQIKMLWRDVKSIFADKAIPEPTRRLVLRPGYADGFEGFGGVLVRPTFFAEEVFDIPEFAKPVDDVWLSGHAMRKGHPAWIIGGYLEPVLEAQMLETHKNENALHRSVFNNKDRDVSNSEVVRYFQEKYQIWL
ncbi:glycosyltransferase family A protein [Shimia abyssi]|uniref:Glycosyl transferase family 2 n=1 Tax=Shimia abyssi TaxID=1662395 RepID=A0A2P8FKW0_9RHOB|nr:glycosyltransferase family A protein [Shimia abyssi]PSL22346.1 hypothetical protein CLV88_101773 [Shimia abyssi]